MIEQIKILNSLIGKKLNAIVLKDSEHTPLPMSNHEYISNSKEIGILVEAKQPWDMTYILTGIVRDFARHSNPYKLRIENAELIDSPEDGTRKLNRDYRTVFNINFIIGSIHLYEEASGNHDLEELRTSDLLPNALIISDESSIQKILINCYYNVDEEIQIYVRFHLGDAEDILKLNRLTELRYVNLVGSLK